MNQGRAANRGGLDEATLLELVQEGLTLTEMAHRLDRSISTVRYGLQRHGHWPLASGRRRIAARRAREQGLNKVELECSHHGLTEFVLEAGSRYRCLKCRREAVIAWRRRAKLRLVEEAGGRCVLCGYDEFAGALQFHHRDRSEKSFGLAMGGLTRSIAELRREAAKWVRLCANCHAKIEWGAAQLPEDLLRSNGSKPDANLGPV